MRNLYSIGHSNRTLEQFIKLLKAYKIKQIVDVRTVPKSRHNPQFNKTELAKSLRNVKIGYRHMKKLGGLRHAKADSKNLAWKNLSFRGFADYMGTDEFDEAIEKLKVIASRKKTAIMCAEAVPWRCHRSSIADAMFVRKFKVWHLMGLKSLKEHALTPWAKVKGVKIWYPN